MLLSAPAALVSKERDSNSTSLWCSSGSLTFLQAAHGTTEPG